MHVIQFCYHGGDQQVLDCHLSYLLGVQLEHDLAGGSDHIKGVVKLRGHLDALESRHHVVDHVLDVFLAQISVSQGVLQGQLDHSLCQIDVPDALVEERHDVYAAVLVPVELEEGRREEEPPALDLHRLGHEAEALVVDALHTAILARLRHVVLQGLPYLL